MIPTNTLPMSGPNTIASKSNIDNFKQLLQCIHSSFVDNNTDLCIICYEQLSIIANPKCDHCVCFICAIKLLTNNNFVYNCPYCQIESHIILTHSNLLTSREKEAIFKRKFNEKLTKKLIYQDNIAYFLRNKIFIYSDQKDILQKICLATVLLIGKLCWHSDCISKLSQSIKNGDKDAIYRADLDNLNKLSNHLATMHNLSYCHLCYDHFKPLMFEITYYYKDQLSRHRNKGDKSSNPKIDPHVFCKYCKKWFFDVESYNAHSKSMHFICDICDSEKSYNVFSNYTSLFNHFKECHYPCIEESCSFVVFATHTQLLVHYAVEHPGMPIHELKLNNYSNFKIKIGNLRRVKTSGTIENSISNLSTQPNCSSPNVNATRSSSNIMADNNICNISDENIANSINVSTKNDHIIDKSYTVISANNIPESYGKSTIPAAIEHKYQHSDTENCDCIDDTILSNVYHENSTDDIFPKYSINSDINKIFHNTPQLINITTQCELIDHVIDQMDGCEDIFIKHNLPDRIVTANVMDALKWKSSKLALSEEHANFLGICSEFTRSIISVVMSHKFTGKDIFLLDKLKSLFIKQYYNLDLSLLDRNGMFLLSLIVVLPPLPLSKYLCRKSILPDQWYCTNDITNEQQNLKLSDDYGKNVSDSGDKVGISAEKSLSLINLHHSNDIKFSSYNTLSRTNIPIVTTQSPSTKETCDYASHSSANLANKLMKSALTAYRCKWRTNSIHSCLLETIEQSLNVQWKLHVLPSVRETIKEKLFGIDPNGVKQLTNMAKDLGGILPMKFVEECQALSPLFYLYCSQTNAENLDKWAEKWSESVFKAFRHIKTNELCTIYYYLITLRDTVANINDDILFPPLNPNSTGGDSGNHNVRRPSGENSNNFKNVMNNSLMRNFRRMDFASAITGGADAIANRLKKPTLTEFPALKESVNIRK